MLHVELSRFRVKKGKSKVVDAWLKFLNDHMEDTLLTLEDEKMYVESIHREIFQGEEYLYWYSVQGDGGQSIYESKSYIDKKHLEFWNECIDPSFHENDIPTSVTMIPEKIRFAMQEKEK